VLDSQFDENEKLLNTNLRSPLFATSAETKTVAKWSVEGRTFEVSI